MSMLRLCTFPRRCAARAPRAQARREGNHSIPFVPKDPSAGEGPVDPPSSRSGLGKWAEVIHPSDIKGMQQDEGGTHGGAMYRRNVGNVADAKLEAAWIERKGMDEKPLFTENDMAWLAVKSPQDLWKCKNCSHYTPKGLAECEACNHPRRAQQETKGAEYWVCGQCLHPHYVNKKTQHQSKAGTARACWNCGTSQANALQGIFVKGVHWVCKPCKVINSEPTCYSCGEHATQKTEHEPFSRAGTWWCSECGSRNYKTNKKCTKCGYWK